MPTYKTLQGFRDILPDEQPCWFFVEQTAIEVAGLFGYRRIETPVLEETSVFQRSVGEGTDIVEKEMYSFDDRADKEGRSTNITLRPEGTAGSVRAYLEHGLFKLPQPVKLFYFGPFFRREKPQAGRLREHHQFGCEVLGDGDPAIDAELMGLLYQFYTTLGLRQLRVHINSIGDRNCRPQYIKILKDYYRPLLGECCQDCQMRFNKILCACWTASTPRTSRRSRMPPRFQTISASRAASISPPYCIFWSCTGYLSLLIR